MEPSNSHRSRSTNSCRPFPKAIVVCHLFFICVLFVAIVHLSLINANSSHASSIPVVCHSEECYRSEAVFKQNMNLSVDPCDDFYSYVCGHWADNYPPSRSETQSWQNVQDIKIERIIRDHLEAYISRSDPKPVAQAKDMYKACLRSLQAEDDYKFEKEQDRYRFRVIKKYLKKFGLPTIPTLLEHREGPKQNYQFDWISSVAKIQRTLGLNVMIGLSFAVDDRSMHQVGSTLGQFEGLELIDFPWYAWSTFQQNGPASGIRNETSNNSDRDANTTDDQQNEDSYPEELEKTFNRLHAYINSYIYFPNKNNEYYIVAEKFKAFKNQLPELEDVSIDEELTFYTVAELQNKTDSHITPRKPYPVWQHYLDVLFEDFPDNKPDADEKLLFHPKNVKYLCNLIDFISKQSPEHIELYIWRTVVEFFVDHKYNRLRTEERCLNYVQELMDVAAIYAITNRNFLNETKPKVEQMFNDIRSEFDEMILEANWIDVSTKNALLEKSKAMEAHIGFPEWMLNAEILKEHYRDLKADRFNHFENWVNALQILVTKKLQLFNVNVGDMVYIDPKRANAYSFKKFNVINIDGGRFHYPFYHHGLEALNYGALGYTLGHELIHNFDDSGRFKDEFDKQMWSNYSLQQFEERTSCLIEQYDSYYVPEAKGFINGTSTLNENIADEGGVQEAFRAYRAYVKRNGVEPLLPGFESFTHEQLFFMSLGNQYCEKLSSYDPESILKDVHSPAKFRVLGVLSNMEEFSEAFQCPRGSKMNPEKKCRVW